MRRCRLALLLVISFALGQISQADGPPRQAIIDGKAATALVVLPSERGFGSAFCIDPSGLFITNEHVVAGSEDEGVTLVLGAGGKDETVVSARVLRSDRALDIAVLKVKEEGKFTALKLGTDTDLVETDTIVAFGYPFGTDLAVREQAYPNISVNVGRVTAIRQANGQLVAIQVDAQLNPGNSGGPVIDKDGRVVGVVASGIERSGVSFAVPVSKLQDWLATPTVLFDLPEIDFAQRHEEIEFPIEIAAIGREEPEFTVHLTIGDDERTVTAKKVSSGKYVAKISPLKAKGNAVEVNVQATFKNGSIQGVATDASVRVADKRFRLSQTRSIERTGKKWVITDSGGKEVTVTDPPQATVQMNLGDKVIVPIDLSLVRQLIVAPPTERYEIPYRLTTNLDGKIVNEKTGVLHIGGQQEGGFALAKGSLPRPIKSKLTKPVIINFTTPYTDFCLGGAGQFLIFMIAEERKILVVDVTKGEVVKVIDSPTEGDLIAASREKLFIVSPSKMMLQRWNLKTMKRDKIAQLLIADAPKRALMGATGDGPLMLTSKSATLIDIETLKPLPVEGNLIGGEGRYGYLLTSSHQGNVYTGCVWGISPAEFQMMRIGGGHAVTKKFGSVSNAVRWATPTADGSLVLSSVGIYSAFGRKVEASGIPGAIFPTVDPRYFLGMNVEGGKADLAICTTADCRKIWHQQGGFEELVPKRINSWHDIIGALQMGDQWRVQYIPWAGVIATMPKDNKALIIRPFDVVDQLKQDKLPYLFVDSVPPIIAFTGERLDYQIAVKSSNGRLAFKKEDGPPGCKVSSNGRVTWEVPANLAPGFARIIVSVRDKGGEEIFHTFEVAVGSRVKQLTVQSGP